MLLNFIFGILFLNNVIFYYDDITNYYLIKTMITFFCINYKAIRDYIVFHYYMTKILFLGFDIIYNFIFTCKLNMLYFCINYIKKQQNKIKKEEIVESSKFKTKEDIDNFLESC